MTPRAVIFDCDGVLVDSEPMTDEVIATNLARHGLVLPPERISSLFLGGTISGLGDTARTMGADLPHDWLDGMYAEIFERLAQGTPLIDGIDTVLDALDAANIAYGVGSNGSHRKMGITLGQHPAVYERLKGRLFSRHDVSAPKPDPALYLHAAAALNVSPADCAVIEDSPTGCKAAARAGMRCFGYAPRDNGSRLAAEAAIVFHDMRRLPELLGL
ncbi:MAG: HAD family phosphatase [Paracoccaceae bacterium]|nr:HAD family phosphatase [Paracoccaceae bacterium]